MLRRNVWLICLMMMLWMSYPIQAQSEQMSDLEELRQQVTSQILAGQRYQGSIVLTLILEIIDAAEESIAIAYERGRVEGAAEAGRQLKPQMAGVETRLKAVEKTVKKGKWETIGGIFGGFLAGWVARAASE